MDQGPPLKKLYDNLFLLLGLGIVLLFGTLLYAIFGNAFNFSTQGKMQYEQTKITAGNQTAAASDAFAPGEVVDGIHVPTGLKVAEGFDVVRPTCTACHSGKLVAQNRATRQGWEEMIRWMQETQGLWPLGENEPIILDYLATNYGPEETGRRANLEAVEWYILELD